MSFVENRTPFFRDFGVNALVAGTSVRGIFDNGYGAAFDGFVGSQQPTFMCDADAVDAATQGGSLVLGDVAYEITNIEPDGVGMTTLRLRKT